MFVNSSPQRWLADGNLSYLYLTHLPLTPYSNKTIVTSQSSVVSLYARPLIKKKIDVRQIAKNRHIATPSTNQMRDLLGMIHG